MAIPDSIGPDFSLEEGAMLRGFSRVAGVDEAGRGPWAGPVVAAAVVLNPRCIPNGLNDSKKLTESKRESLFGEIMNCADVGVGIADVERIDKHNILQATLWAMG
ncbi:MAG: ribonuclease HII, partial [Rhizobiales bacterium]|nr:ribonuclease HII [Hyphomicrobiales bacterium]